MGSLSAMPVVLIALAILVLLATASVLIQLTLPRIAERRIRARLVEYGGEADVRVRAFPATRLLRNAGDRIEVRGHGLEIAMARPAGGSGGAEGATDSRRSSTSPSSSGSAGLSALDGFSSVDLELVDFRTGPFAVDAFVLEREGGGTYAMGVRAQTTASELATLGAESFSLPGGTLIGSVAGATPLGSRTFSVSLQIELISGPDGLRVGAGGGTIAGYPAGPLATTIAAAVARRLEIVP